MPSTGPIPVYPSTRLLGLEVEVDAGLNNKLKLPSRLPNGWNHQHDESLHNGRELILVPPENYTNALPKIVALYVALDELGTYASKRGGYHVHVQVADYTLDDAVRLANLYRHFQPVLDTLVAQSRVNNTYCPPYRTEVTAAVLEDMFDISNPASSRGVAKCSRSYSVANFAMMRCENRNDRTVEFRQGSTSKRADCIAGWAAVMLALVDLAKTKVLCEEAMELPVTLAGFCRVMLLAEGLTGAKLLADWVRWRYDYLNEEPTQAMVDAAVAAIGTRWHGMFFVARELNVNNALAQRILDKGLHQGKLVKHDDGRRYRSTILASAGEDFDELVTAMLGQTCLQNEAAPV